MGGFEEIDEGIIAGEKVGNADFGASAAIKPLKIEKRAHTVIMEGFSGAVLTGAGVAIGTDTTFPKLTLPNANAGSFTTPVRAPKGELVPGERPTLHIWWNTAEITGSLRLVVDIRPVIEGALNLSSAIQKAVITPAQGSANQLQEALIEFGPSIFNNNQLWFLKIARDPTNTLDTCAGDININGIYITMNGRC